MKKAFMRGVCALNMEAMTMFNDPSSSSHHHVPGTISGTVPGTVSGTVSGTVPGAATRTHRDTETASTHNGGMTQEYGYGFQSVSQEKPVSSSCRHLNVRFHKPTDKKGTRKTQPLVSVERHVPSK